MEKTLFASRLKDLRGNVPQATFAAQIGAKQTTYSSWERGKKEPPLKVLAEISRQFGVTTDWLLGLPERGRSADGAADALKVAALKGAIQAILDKF